MRTGQGVYGREVEASVPREEVLGNVGIFGDAGGEEEYAAC
jgi:hypothetical protein